MRTGPVALAHPEDPGAIATLARSISELTHPDQDCVDACVLWSVAIDHTIHHAPASNQPWDWAESVRAGLAHLATDRRDRWADLIDEAAGTEPAAFEKNGWVVHAFQAALAAICATPVPAGTQAARHLPLALDRAVRCGGDTDTVAAIAGALLGARWGATALPFAWRRVIHGRRTYDTTALQTADLERLARLAFKGGHPDSSNWPGAASLLPHYERDWPDVARRATLGGVEFGNVAAMRAAVSDGADVVISFCRMGTEDVPARVEHHVIGLIDSDDATNPNLDVVLAEVVDGLTAYVAEGRQVYVHCVQAHNRTPTVAAAWLCRAEGLSADDALVQVAAAF
jgi:hypothetical protein